ncbi:MULTISPECIES: CRISPR-associated endonuclease Cas2 [Basfia]|uniref:CRISPR-associated endoribonuclease Cas2 n=2 Tax=Basfia TaxID=697331 RepID=Q65TX3_MANSM|nr:MULTISPECIES: CRISPR-associated endonuclease Cas2 [Basfia]AAU37587.1 unknown [[Mannheimia] succiniciproducens MBEL55E]QIM68369.1 CRISPR-associated endonuclease Cas2 [Basfia succiniciproducens]SCX90414.1 CRISPR-associated protein, Cas2 family [Basfia succiniciproducens]SEP97483.1 CRISPR-associated protein, Cas2 family [Basfia succiniciproducens]
MMILITYDVSLENEGGERRLRHIAKHCLDYGIRVQYSVFECEVTPAQWVELKDKLLNTYDKETDSLRFYQLGSKWKHRVEHYGAKRAIDMFRDILII